MVDALLTDVPTEVQQDQDIYYICIRDELDDSRVDMPKKRTKVNPKLVGDRPERDKMVMGLGLARAGVVDDEMVFRRLGLMRWVR